MLLCTLYSPRTDYQVLLEEKTKIVQNLEREVEQTLGCDLQLSPLPKGESQVVTRLSQLLPFFLDISHSIVSLFF